MYRPTPPTHCIVILSEGANSFAQLVRFWYPGYHSFAEQHESLVHELLVLAIASGACNTQDMLLMSTGGVQDGVERM